MPRSPSPRKYRSHREKRKHRKHSNYRDSSSRSRSSSERHHNRHRHDRHRRNRDHSYRKNERSRHRKYDESSDADRSRRRERSSSSYSRKRQHSRKHRKHEKSDRKQKHGHKHYKKSDDSRTQSVHKHKHHVKKNSEDDKDRSKDAGHYKYREGTILGDRYKIVKHLGDGTFGRVLEAEDLETHQHFAVKVIRAVKRYVESAQTEAEILEDIKNKDPEDKHKVVRLEAAFLKDPSRPDKEQNYFMIFERLGKSLYDFLKMNHYRGFSIEYIQSFAQQILTSIGFMHSIGLTHTDLKPENILLVNDETVPIKCQEDSDIDDRSSTCSKSEDKIYYKPRYDNIKIIDMGGATYEDEHHSSVINTRQYRAPEVMLTCCPWSFESDVWSIGCILLELYTGELFFETHETYEHLAMIDRACGPIPFWMGNRAESKMRKYFMLEEDYFKKHGTFFDWPRHASNQESIKRVKNMKLIDDLIPSDYPELRDLLKKMLTIDPKLRIKCSEALEHAFFKVKYE